MIYLLAVVILLQVASWLYNRKQFKILKMKNADLLALLQNEDAELGTIATGVTNLLIEIANADNVPQNIQDAANKLQTDMDAVNAQVNPTPPPPPAS